MNQIIKDKLEAIRQILSTHKVQRAYLFGSSVTDTFDSDSDIDLLVRFDDSIPALEKGELWWSLYDTLRDLLKREVDLMTENSLKNPYFIEELERTKQLIYGHQS
ncbi:MAG: nucleotidyltransferase family protein [Runella sp.]